MIRCKLAFSALIAVNFLAANAILTAQQQPSLESPRVTVETIVQTLGGNLTQDETGAVGYVDLNGTPVTDGELKYFADLPSLTGLDLHNTQITDAGVAHLTGLSALHFLNLSGT